MPLEIMANLFFNGAEKSSDLRFPFLLPPPTPTLWPRAPIPHLLPPLRPPPPGTFGPFSTSTSQQSLLSSFAANLQKEIKNEDENKSLVVDEDEEENSEEDSESKSIKE